MIIDDADKRQLIRELCDLEEALMARPDVVDGIGPVDEGLLLARVIAGMTEEDWDRTGFDQAGGASWIPMPLNRDKGSVLVRLQQKIDWLVRASNRDFLTGIYNRRFFLRAFKREMEKVERYHMPLTLVLIDIDDFKSINDTHGHVAGDRVLKAVADLLQSQVRAGDYVGRIGGEEFALALPGTGMRRSRPVLSRIQSKIRDSVMAESLEGAPIRCTLSMGAATYIGMPLITVEQLMTHADRELYSVKRGGKNAFRMMLVTDESVDRSLVKKAEKDFLMRG